MKTKSIIAGLLLILLSSCGTGLKPVHTDAIFETLESQCYNKCVEEKKCHSLDDVVDSPKCFKECFNKCVQRAKQAN